MRYYSDNSIAAIMPMRLTENTSWKVLAYGIYTRVVFVSEIERVRAANESDFWYKNQRVGKYRTKHFTCGIVFIVYILRQKKTSLLECVRSDVHQAARKGGNFGAQLTHLCGFWLDVSFSHM